MISLTYQDDIALFQLNNPPANATDLDLCKQLKESIQAEQQSASKAIVLTNQGNIFSAGADLVQLVEGGNLQLITSAIPGQNNSTIESTR